MIICFDFPNIRKKFLLCKNNGNKKAVGVKKPP
jgi:hypothetical protein